MKYNGHTPEGGYEMPDSFEDEEARACDQSNPSKMFSKSLSRKPIKEHPNGEYPEVNERLEALNEKALQIMLDEEIEQSKRLIHLREYNKRESKLNVSDQDLRMVLADARRTLAGSSTSVGKRPLNRRPVPWLLEKIFMPRCLNLFVSPPKCGKTSLVVGLLGEWFQGTQTYINQEIIGKFPPVLIVGSDQPESDWAEMLANAGLLDEEDQLVPQIIDLFTSGQPLTLDEEGIDRISKYAEIHKGLLIIVDSLAACIRNLGLDENSPDVAEPIALLLEAIAPHEATLLLIHHAGKAHIGQSPSLASRGSTALPALASQTISLERMMPYEQGSSSDNRRILKTDGRGGRSIELLIEQVGSSTNWICHGDAEAVQRQRHREKNEESLEPRQQEVLAVVRKRWLSNQAISTAKDINQTLVLGEYGDRKARASLDQLEKKGLVQSHLEKTDSGSKKHYRPNEDY